MNIFKIIWPEFPDIQGVNIGLADLNDAERIGILSRELIETGLVGWSWHPERVAKRIRNPDALVLVARVKDRLVAFAIMSFGDEVARLELLAVEREYQRSGIGSCLVRFLENSAYVLGNLTIKLEVRARNQSARAFYRSLGYHEFEHLPRYYSDSETAVCMTRRQQTKPLARISVKEIL